MPLLVKLIDSEIDILQAVASQVPNGFDNLWSVFEEIAARRLTVDPDTSIADLNVDPVDGNIELGGKLQGTQQLGRVLPPGSLLGDFNASAKTQALHGDGQYLFNASWRTMSFARQNSSNFIIRGPGSSKFERALAHLPCICKIGDCTDAHFDLKLA